jgi:hypothetical protein
MRRSRPLQPSVRRPSVECFTASKPEKPTIVEDVEENLHGRKRRSARAPQWLGEFVATFGLLTVIWGCAGSRKEATPYAVAAYVSAPINLRRQLLSRIQP